MVDIFIEFIGTTGFMNLTIPHLIMLIIACFLLFLAIGKGFEPLLLVPISFGMLLTNLPLSGMMEPMTVVFEILTPGGGTEGVIEAGMEVEQTIQNTGGLLKHFYTGNQLGIFPPLIFLGVGAMTDFGPLIANPKSVFLGAAAQFGIFFTFIGAILMGFTPQAAGSIGIIGGADGPTAILVATLLAPELLGPIAVAAYSYMALVPIIQPPIMKALTNSEERKIKMEQLRPVSKKEKIIFPILVAIIVSLLLPPATPLIGMLMFGNLLKECTVTDRLSQTAQNELINIVTILLGISVGASAKAEQFLELQTIQIIVLGMVAFGVGTASGVIIAKLMNKITKKAINPLIGAAGVSAVPMAARVVQTVGQKENPSNFLLMHAMGPNVSGVIGSAIAAGVMISLFGG